MSFLTSIIIKLHELLFYCYVIMCPTWIGQSLKCWTTDYNCSLLKLILTGEVLPDSSDLWRRLNGNHEPQHGSDDCVALNMRAYYNGHRKLFDNICGVRFFYICEEMWYGQIYHDRGTNLVKWDHVCYVLKTIEGNIYSCQVFWCITLLLVHYIT